jgi:hypothetical protein
VQLPELNKLLDRIHRVWKEGKYLFQRQPVCIYKCGLLPGFLLSFSVLGLPCLPPNWIKGIKE